MTANIKQKKSQDVKRSSSIQRNKQTHEGLQHLLQITFIFFFTLTIYANTLYNGFVYDDYEIIVDNYLIRELGNLPILFQQDYFAYSGEMSYRPIVTLTYFIDYALFGLNPFGFHLINILLHAVNGLLLYIFLNMFLEKPKVLITKTYITNSLLITFLFVAHPVLTEAVNAISFREDLLAFLFYIATLNLYLFLRSNFLGPRKSRSFRLLYIASCLLYALALLSKEIAITLPLIIYCYEWIYRDKANVRFTFANPYNLGYLLISLFYLYIRFYYFYNPIEEDLPTWELTERFITIPWLLLHYLKIMLFPISLNVDYVIKPAKLLQSRLYIGSLIAIPLLFITAFSLRKKYKEISFGILFFFIVLMPVYNIIPIANPFAERYLYLPSFGFACILGGGICYIAEPLRSKHVMTVLVVSILSLYSLKVLNRNAVWENGISLWSDAIKRAPDSSRAHYNLGFAYHRDGNFVEAIKEYRIAQDLNPSDYEIYNNLAAAYEKLGLYSESLDSYKKALDLKPIYPEARNNLGLLYARRGKLEDAISQYQDAVEQNPEFVEAHYNLGVAYSQKGLKDAAIKEFKMVLKLRPDYIQAQEAIEYLGDVE